MALEYHTVKFSNDGAGIGQKNIYANQMAAQGWHIASEVIEQGHIKGGEACCGFMICAPLAFLAGRTPAMIVTTFARETPIIGSKACPKCGAQTSAGSAFCAKCGTQIAP
jgi:hypothetical protein